MTSSEPEHTRPTMRRRSFVARLGAAVVAGFSAGHLLRHVAEAASAGIATRKAVSVRPHPEAVSRTNPRPPSHE